MLALCSCCAVRFGWGLVQFCAVVRCARLHIYSFGRTSALMPWFIMYAQSNKISILPLIENFRNPLGKVPFLEDPSCGLLLPESAAILAYLADK